MNLRFSEATSVTSKENNNSFRSILTPEQEKHANLAAEKNKQIVELETRYENSTNDTERQEIQSQILSLSHDRSRLLQASLLGNFRWTPDAEINQKFNQIGFDADQLSESDIQMLAERIPTSLAKLYLFKREVNETNGKIYDNPVNVSTLSIGNMLIVDFGKNEFAKQFGGNILSTLPNTINTVEITNTQGQKKLIHTTKPIELTSGDIVTLIA